MIDTSLPPSEWPDLKPADRAWLGAMVSFHGIARVIPKGSAAKRYYYMRITIKLRRYPESIPKMARIAPPSYVPGKDTRAGRFGKFVYEGSKAKYLMEQAWPYLEPRRKKQYLRNYIVMQARNSIARADREGRRRRALQEALIAQKRTSAEAQRRRELLYHNQDPAIQVVHTISIEDVHEMVMALHEEDRLAISAELDALLANPMLASPSTRTKHSHGNSPKRRQTHD